MDLLLRSALPLSVNLNCYGTKVATHINPLPTYTYTTSKQQSCVIGPLRECRSNWQALPGFLITAHHSCAFLCTWRAKLCGGITIQKITTRSVQWLKGIHHPRKSPPHSWDTHCGSSIKALPSTMEPHRVATRKCKKEARKLFTWKEDKRSYVQVAQFNQY